MNSGTASSHSRPAAKQSAATDAAHHFRPHVSSSVSEAGLAPADRQRDIYPMSLPERGHHPVGAGLPCHAGRQRRHAVSHALDWADSGINSLNDLYGAPTPADVAHGGVRAPNLAQRLCQQHVLKSYLSVDAPPADLSRKEALSELLAGSAVYGDCSTRRAYSRHDVAWPDMSSDPAFLESMLSEADCIWLRSWREHLRRPETGAESLRKECCPHGAYVEPALSRSPSAYRDFLLKFQQCGMIRWRFNPSRGSLLGVCLLQTKNGQQRIIFDTRTCNCYFKTAASTRLPTASAFSSLEVGEAGIFAAPGDIHCSFYNMRVPEGLDEYFLFRPSAVV